MKDLVLDVELMKPLDRIAGASLLKVFIYSFLLITLLIKSVITHGIPNFGQYCMFKSQSRQDKIDRIQIHII